MASSAAASPTAQATRIKLSGSSGFGLVELAGGSPLRAQFLPTGALFALRHGPTLINQILPGPPDDGLFRLLLRWHGDDERPDDWARLVGAGITFNQTAPDSATWTCVPAPGLFCETRFQVHPTLPAWSWRIRLRNASLAPFKLDVLLAQDLGLADEAAVRNNEAYVSHYIDLLPVRDDTLGWTILARQNQPMAENRHPWLAVACTTGATDFCTDGWQFFGADHRLTGTPAAVRSRSLASQHLQYEAALAGLQSRVVELKPGGEAEMTFVARFLKDHPTASSAMDLELVRALHEKEKRANEGTTRPRRASPRASAGASVSSAVHTEVDPPFLSGQSSARSHASSRSLDKPLFVEAPWLHGDTPAIGDWDAWFHGVRRHEEFDADDALLSFFHGAQTHVVAREKEATVARPHGHILRSGKASWFDAEHFGLTCYAAGIFAAQAYLGHPSFARLLSVVRNALNVTRSSGQRVFLRRDGKWHQLGIPSAFAITPGDVRWIYRLGNDVIEARAWCAENLAASFLELSVAAGLPGEFLITHELALGAAEFEHGGTLTFHREDGWVSCAPAPETLVGRHQPDTCFAIAFTDATAASSIDGDGPLYGDGADRRGPYVTLHTKPVEHCGILLLGSPNGVSSLTDQVALGRSYFQRTERTVSPRIGNGGTTSVSSATVSSRSSSGLSSSATDGTEIVPPSQESRAHAASPPSPPLRMSGTTDAGVARINEILPWFTHNAAIHFSAPHGLEQYGGAAWGVRDVCQGSVEWLIAAGEFAIVRRILETVFAQQYPHDGGWPQWFMFPPYQFIQQAHSHGDVCFWPVKALCDYLAASNDLAFLDSRIGYTDPKTFERCGPEHTIIEHCDQVIAQTQARFFPGTTLVNYGDGDWDDTLQPADPAMRTRMISAWTVGLAFQTFRQFAEVCRRCGSDARATVLTEMLVKMRDDFVEHLMPGGVVAGFVYGESEGGMRPLLHPQDEVTRIRYRLLPMTRSILAHLFTLEEAQQHLAIVAAELVYPDGARLMSEPATYRGGVEHWFKRADTAANVGREIGLQYVHAHLRYAEALARMGAADGFWQALQIVNPVALSALVPHAAPRQSNAYFSSSDADFPDRYQAAKRWSELWTGRVAVRGGWRIYSSGPGLFLHAIRAYLLGVRESFDDIVFDPVLPLRLNGLVAQTKLCGCVVELRYKIVDSTHSPRRLTVNGTPCDISRREANPYRPGGVLISRTHLTSLLHPTTNNTIDLEL